jgi:hypothetical protein
MKKSRKGEFTMEENEKTILNQQEKTLEQMAEERRQLFESLGVSESNLLDALKDKRNFSPETWELMQQKRQELEEILDKKIGATSQPIELFSSNLRIFFLCRQA